MTPETLQAVAGAVDADPDPNRLRAGFPDLHFTFCGEDDVPARLQAAVECRAHRLFLITGASGHCIEFTADAAGATGVVVASRMDEDD